MTPARTKGLSRRDDNHGHYWDARTRWRGQIRRSRFYDHRHGGKRAARRAGIRWLNQQDRELGKPITNAWIRSSGAWGRLGRAGKWIRKLTRT